MFLAYLVIGFVVLVIAGRKTLAGLAHLLSLLLVLPSFLFAAACLVLDKAVAHGILGFLEVTLTCIEVMMPWGILVLLVCLSMLAAAGFHRRWRRAAAGTVGMIALASAGVATRFAGWPTQTDQWWCYVPGSVAFIIAVFLSAPHEMDHPDLLPVS